MDGLLGAPKLYSPKCLEGEFSEVQPLRWRALVFVRFFYEIETDSHFLIVFSDTSVMVCPCKSSLLCVGCAGEKGSSAL